MLCPYCNKTMEYGVIQSPTEISWCEKKRFFACKDFNNIYALILSNSNFIRGSTIIAFNCTDCKKILIDYENANCDANKKKLK